MGGSGNRDPVDIGRPGSPIVTMNRDSAKTALERSSKVPARLLSVIWPFLLTIAGGVALALLSMQLMSAGRAYVSGESLWSKGQKNAVLHLGEYALTCDPADFARYEQALAVPKGDRIARLALSQAEPDQDRAREGFLQGQNHPSDVDDMIMLFLRFGKVSFMREAIDIWTAADALIDELDAAAAGLKRVVEAQCADERGKQQALAAILEVNERLTPLQRAFSDTVGQANRIVHLLTGAALLLLTALLTALGVRRSLWVQGRHAQAERRLSDSEQRYQLAIAGSRQGLWDIDVVSGHLFVSPELEQMLDYPVGSFGSHRQDIIRRLHPEERDDVVRQLNALVIQGQGFETELRVLDGRGEYRWVRAAGRARLGPGGKPARMLGSIQDISARKALEARLQAQTRSREAAIEELRQVLERDLSPALGALSGPGEVAREGMTASASASAGTDAAGADQGPAGSGSGSEGDSLEQISHLVALLVAELKQRGQHLDAIFALSPDGFVSFDPQLRINHVNAAFTRLTGLPEAVALGLSEAELQQRLQALQATQSRMPSLSELRQTMAEHAAEGQRPRIELERPAQRVIELHWQLGQGEPITQVLYLRDVTHETEVERIKSEFLSTAAHELRTPMASIIGFSELLLMRSYPPARQAELLQTVHRQAQRMSRIVDELLDLARIEARRGKDFLIERLDLCSLVEEAVRDFSVPAQRTSPHWSPCPQPLWVEVDRGKLMQALANVLSNAYKYSPDGGPVSVRLVRGAPVGGPAARAGVGVQVQDSGIGMSPEQLARMGERFYRADASGNIPGTGLGVSIVQEILQLLGGRVEFSSALGEGTTVTLWLPESGQD